MRFLIALSLLIVSTASAQSAPEKPPPKPDAKTEAPEPRPGTPQENAFVPSEEVSADKEVDFPADL